MYDWSASVEIARLQEENNNLRAENARLRKHYASLVVQNFIDSYNELPEHLKSVLKESPTWKRLKEIVKDW